MTRVALQIADDANRITVKALLEAEGFLLVADGAEVIVCDDAHAAESAVSKAPVLLLSPAHNLPQAVQAMRRGVFGYVFQPMVAGELGLMVRRAAGAAPVAKTRPHDGGRPLEQVEREHIMEVLRACKQNQAEAARRLGIGRNTLWRKLKRMRAEASS